MSAIERAWREFLEFMKYFGLYGLPISLLMVWYISAGAPIDLYPAVAVTCALWAVYNSYGAYKAFKAGRPGKALGHLAAVITTLILWASAHAYYTIKLLEPKIEPKPGL